MMPIAFNNEWSFKRWEEDDEDWFIYFIFKEFMMEIIWNEFYIY